MIADILLLGCEFKDYWSRLIQILPHSSPSLLHSPCCLSRLQLCTLQHWPIITQVSYYGVMWSESHAWVWKTIVLFLLILQTDDQQTKKISSGFLNTILVIFGISLMFSCLSLCQSTRWNSPSWELRAWENCSPRLSLVLDAASIFVSLIPQVTILPRTTVPAWSLTPWLHQELFWKHWQGAMQQYRKPFSYKVCVAG